MRIESLEGIGLGRPRERGLTVLGGRASVRSTMIDKHGGWKSPAARPLKDLGRGDILKRFERGLAKADGVMGAHCVHELWMRGDLGVNVERALERLWAHAAASIPEWLPMRFVEWLPAA
jgi:hypothetical protein